MVATKHTAYGALIVLLASLIAYTYAMRYRRVEAPSPPAFDGIPLLAAGRTADEGAIDQLTIDVLRADAALFRTYRGEGVRPISLFIGYFASPQEHSQIHSPKNCYPGAGWTIVAEGTSAIVVGGAECAATNIVISNGIERHFVLYWYLAADEALADEFALKWSQMKSSLLGRRRATAFIRFSTEIEENGDAAEAERSLARFAQTLAPYIEGALLRGGAAGGRPETPPHERKEP